MFFAESSYLGIDPTAGHKPFAYAALDNDLHLTARGLGTLDEVLAFMASQAQAMAGICAPRRPSQALMRRPQVRDRLSPPPRPGRFMDFRVAEYLLRQHGISCIKTPADEKTCPNWMKMGFTLYQRLKQMGYHPFPARGHSLQMLEVYPHASFCTLLGRVPLPKTTLEGRFQRQLVLYQHKLGVPDPMDLVKEATPQSILAGAWPSAKLYTPGELDALVAAYTAWQAANHPDQITPVGDDREGLVIVPVAELKRHY
jgi:Protein of unknown function (DUF429)